MHNDCHGEEMKCYTRQQIIQYTFTMRPERTLQHLQHKYIMRNSVTALCHQSSNMNDFKTLKSKLYLFYYNNTQLQTGQKVVFLVAECLTFTMALDVPGQERVKEASP